MNAFIQFIQKTFSFFVIHKHTVKNMITLSIPKLLYIKKIYFFSLLHISMSGKNINFNDKKIKSDFYKNKKVNKMENMDVNKILVSKKEPYGTKN